jgi:kumamolisin
MGWWKIAIVASIGVSACIGHAQTSPAATDMGKFTPASSIPKLDLTVGEILQLHPNTMTSSGKLLSEVVPFEAQDSLEDLRAAPYLEPRAHTNFDGYKVFVALAPETPQTIACLYFDGRKADKQCRLDAPLKSAVGGNQQTIAVVIAYEHNQDLLEGDMKSFDKDYSLNDPNITIYRSTTGGIIGNDTSEGYGWNIEASLDLEWAHAMAPDANLILVEAEDERFSALSQAVKIAGQKVQDAGGGVVSMSWSFLDTNESPISDNWRQQFDNILKSYDKVTFVAAAGDSGVVEYPASSPFAIAVGGTMLVRDQYGAFARESAWKKSGSGLSAYSRPLFQDGIDGIPSDRRGIADISAISDNDKGGVAVFTNSLSRIGAAGTSVATPIIAGLILNARARPNQSFNGTAEQQTVMYGHRSTAGQTVFNEIADGDCGLANFHAVPGWNFCGGVGTPNGLGGFYASGSH